MAPAGRPQVGTPINIRLGNDLLVHVDEYAAELRVSRAEAIRHLVQIGLEHSLPPLSDEVTFCRECRLVDGHHEVGCSFRPIITHTNREAANEQRT